MTTNDTILMRKRVSVVSPGKGVDRQRGSVAHALALSPHARAVDLATLPEQEAAAPAAAPAFVPLPPKAAPSIALRTVEIIVALIALVLTAPVMLVVAIIIRLDSPGPVIFRQKRVGRNGELFTFIKFRTLYADARERFPELYAYKYSPDELDRLHFKVEQDPRVTPAGRWLRRSTLDELPNFWNVLTGDMALVGPRPEIPEMLAYYEGDMKRKFTVRPGVTGLAQIGGRGRLSFRDTVAMDVDYVENRTARFDAWIVLKTIQKIVMRDGAF